MIALLLGLKRFTPRVPAPLVTVGAGIAAMALLGLAAYGVETVGEIPRGLPALTLPDFALVGELWPGSLGIALMSFTETMAAGRAFAQSRAPPIRPNQELITGGATLLTLLLLAPLISLMPQATLAAVVIAYCVGLIELSEFRAILPVRRTEFIWAVAAFAGVVLLGTLKGILVAIAISLVSLAQQVADPPVYRLGRKRGTSVFRPLSAENPDDETFDGLLMVRPVGRLFFVNGQRVAEKLRSLIAEAKPRVVVLHLGAVFDVEYSVLKMLAEGEARIRERGVSLWVAGLTPEVLTAVRRSPFGQALGQERMFFNLEQAVAAYQALQAPSPAPLRGQALAVGAE